jgi:uncharacterized membrane protein YqjE
VEGRDQGLGAAVRDTLAHLCEALVLRGELASLEFTQERRRLFSLLAWFTLVAFTGVMAILFASFFIVAVFWDSHRLTAIGTIGGLYLAIALVAFWRLHHVIDRLPPILAETIGVLRKDYTCLFGDERNSSGNGTPS